MPLKTASTTWIDGMTLDGQARQHHVMIDSPGDMGDDRGPSPVELTLMGLAGCTAMDVVSILKKKRQPFTGLTVRAEGTQADGHPYRFTTVTLTYEVSGDGVDLKAVERAVELSEEKYCSVSATFQQITEVITKVELVAEE